MREKLVFSTYLLAVMAFYTGSEALFSTPKWAFLAALVVVLSWSRNMPERSLSAWFLVLWSVVGLGWAINPLDGLMGLGLPLLVIAGGFFQGPLAQPDRVLLARGLGLGGLLTVAYLLAQWWGFDWVVWERGSLLGAFFGNPNFAADFVLLALCLGRFWPGMPCFAARLFLLLGLVLCRSRGVWLMVLIWYLYRYPGMDQLWRRLAAVCVLVGLVAVLVVWRADVPLGFRYFSDPASYVSEAARQPEEIDYRDPWFRGKRASLITRYIMWCNTVGLIGDHFWGGVGAGQFQTYYPIYSDAVYGDMNMSDRYRARSPHNLILELALQFGVPWLLLLAWLVWRKRRSAAVFASEHRDYLVALTLQLLLAMVGLNYLNAVVVVSLVLLRPGAQVTAGGAQPAIAAVLPISLCVLGLVLLDLSVVREGAPVGLRAKLFPAELAAECYEHNDLLGAWSAQVRAAKQDPAGPETIYNLGLIALARYEETGAAIWLEAGSAAFYFVERRYPFYVSGKRQWDELCKRYGRENLGVPGDGSANIFALNPLLDHDLGRAKD